MIASSSQYLSPSAEGIKKAAELLAAGGLVAFPTETVYGLGANALDALAVKNIFVAKGRPLTDPLIVHVSSKEAALQLLLLQEEEEESEMKVVFHKLCDSFWPGPLTIIAKANASIPMEVTAQTGFVGVRVPAHPLALRLLRQCALPIAAPSANRFGHVSPTRASHVMDDLGSRGVYILNGDEEGDGCDSGATCQHGIESTVVKLNKEQRRVDIYRQGVVSQQQLQSALSACSQLAGWAVSVTTRVVDMHAAVPSSSDAAEAGQEAPGQAVTHYSPDVPCLIATSLAAGPASSDSETTVYLSKDVLRREVVVIDFGDQLSACEPLALAYRNLSPPGSVAGAARDLFASLRWSEAVAGARLVLLPAVGAGEGGVGDGLADRLFRAASGRRRAVVVDGLLV